MRVFCSCELGTRIWNYLEAGEVYVKWREDNVELKSGGKREGKVVYVIVR